MLNGGEEKYLFVYLLDIFIWTQLVLKQNWNIFFSSIFLSDIWFPHSELWAFAEGTATLTEC